MVGYLNINRNSGVLAYEIGNDFIKVQFKGTGKIYKYSYGRAGRTHVENMKALAVEGSGLNAYLKRNVTDLFDL